MTPMTPMTIKTAIAFLAAGVISAASVGTAPARVLIQPGAASVIDLSAKEDKDKKKNKGQQQQKKNPGSQNKGAQGGFSQKPSGGSKSGGQKQKSGGQGGKSQQQLGGSKSGGQKQTSGGQGGKSQQQFGGSKSSGQKQKFGGSKGGNQQGGPGKLGPNKNVKIYKPKGGKNYNTVTAKKLHGLPPGSSKAYVHGHNYSVWRGRDAYRFRYHDRWRTFVPLSALAVLLVGPRHYYPYAYISAPEYYCVGRTEDGCLLNWEEVETIEGDLIGHCVAYCPWAEY